MEGPPLQRRGPSLQTDLHQLARKNLTDLRRLQGRVLYSLAPVDFQSVFEISSSFRDCGAPPTTFGKALHFFLSETVMLWDQAIVRNRYKLRSDPESFVSYQRFGWKLLHHVTRGKTVNVLRQLERPRKTHRLHRTDDYDP